MLLHCPLPNFNRIHKICVEYFVWIAIEILFPCDNSQLYSIFINFSLQFFDDYCYLLLFFLSTFDIVCELKPRWKTQYGWLTNTPVTFYVNIYIYIYIWKKNLRFANRKSSTKTRCPYFTFKIILTKKISCQELRLWNEIFTKPHFLYVFI